MTTSGPRAVRHYDAIEGLNVVSFSTAHGSAGTSLFSRLAGVDGVTRTYASRNRVAALLRTWRAGGQVTLVRRIVGFI